RRRDHEGRGLAEGHEGHRRVRRAAGGADAALQRLRRGLQRRDGARICKRRYRVGLCSAGAHGRLAQVIRGQTLPVRATPLRSAAAERWTLAQKLVLGACLALNGVLLVEGLILGGFRPLGPIALPALGALAGAALAGAPGLAGGAAVVFAYYLFNLGYPARFPEFYAHGYITLTWFLALAALAASVLVVRPRVLRAASAEAELSSRREYEQALRESEQRLRIIADNLPALVSYIDLEQRYRFHNRAYEEWLRIPKAGIA